MNKIKQYTLYSLKSLIIIAMLFCLFPLFVACNDYTPEQETNNNLTEQEINDSSQEWKTNYTLPNEEAVNARLLEIYSSKEKMYLLNNTIQRMPCPENQSKMVFNMTYQVNEYAKMVLEDAIAEINSIFTVINPNYNFEINYNPTSEDFESKYSIRMTLTDNFSSPSTMGTAQISTGKYLSNFGITLKDTTLNDLRYLMLTFRHEFMHLLGAGDAYKNSNAEKTTVMQEYTKTKYRTFSNSDVAFIDAYYRNPANPRKDNYIKNYLSNYEKNNTHTQNSLLCAIITKSISNINPQEFEEQLNGFYYNDTMELLNLIKNNFVLNTSFGKNNVSFTELEYQLEHKPISTYFGTFNINEKKYSHGTQKGNMGSSEIKSYTDLTNGILIATPNGKETIFVQINNYVLSFTSDNFFTSTDRTYAITLNNLQYNLTHASIIK